MTDREPLRRDARPQCQPLGSPRPETWDDYESQCIATYGGGYQTEEQHRIFHHGMSTIFAMLRREFKEANECRKGQHEGDLWQN